MSRNEKNKITRPIKIFQASAPCTHCTFQGSNKSYCTVTQVELLNVASPSACSINGQFSSQFHKDPTGSLAAKQWFPPAAAPSVLPCSNNPSQLQQRYILSTQRSLLRSRSYRSPDMTGRQAGSPHSATSAVSMGHTIPLLQQRLWEAILATPWVACRDWYPRWGQLSFLHVLYSKQSPIEWGSDLQQICGTKKAVLSTLISSTHNDLTERVAISSHHANRPIRHSQLATMGIHNNMPIRHSCSSMALIPTLRKKCRAQSTTKHVKPIQLTNEKWLQYM